MAVGTAGSRATGMLRTMALAWALGVSTLSDAYNTANTAPNMLFALVAGGVLSSAIVPMLARHDDDQGRTDDASVVLGSVTAISIVVALIMAVGAPWLMELLAAGAGGRAGREGLLQLGTQWMRVFALQVPCYAISVAAMGVLTARRRLTFGAAAGIATNIVTIAAVGLFVLDVGGRRPSLADVDGSAVALLGWGTTLGVAVMAALQLWDARRALPGLRFTPRLRHPAMTELRQLGGWVLLYVAANQIGLAVVVSMASSVAGGVSAYQWAFMLMQLPYAVVAVSLFSSAYPSIASRAAKDGDVTSAVARPALVAIDLLLPAAAGLALFAVPLAVLVVGEGSGLVAAALGGFAVSLVPFSMFQLLTRASYARRDSRTPALVNIAANAAMLAIDAAALALPLGPRATVAGLALGHAGSYVVACLLLYHSLRWSGALRAPDPGWIARLAVPAGSSVVMVAVLVLVPVPTEGGRMSTSLWLGVAAAVGTAIYLGCYRAIAPLVRRPSAALADPPRRS